MIYIVKYQEAIICSQETLEDAVADAITYSKVNISYEEIECLESRYTTAKSGEIYYTTNPENGFKIE